MNNTKDEEMGAGMRKVLDYIHLQVETYFCTHSESRAEYLWKHLEPEYQPCPELLEHQRKTVRKLWKPTLHSCDQYDNLFKATKAVFHSQGSYHIHMHRYCAGVSKYHSLPGNEQLYAVFVSYSGLLRLGSICFGQRNIATVSLHMKVTQEF